MISPVLLPRRKFLLGLFGVVAAPAVVHATSLMPIKVWTPTYAGRVRLQIEGFNQFGALVWESITLPSRAEMIMEEIRTRKRFKTITSVKTEDIDGGNAPSMWTATQEDIKIYARH